MPNHFHLLLLQNTDLPISVLMHNIIGGYSKCFNKKYGRVGSLFQDQFKAVHITEDSQLLHTSAYIHNNPVLAGLANEPGRYPYSSYCEYVAHERQSRMCDTKHVLGHFRSVGAYQAFVAESMRTTLQYK